jgi:hypothetical protein
MAKVPQARVEAGHHATLSKLAHGQPAPRSVKEGVESVKAPVQLEAVLHVQNNTGQNNTKLELPIAIKGFCALFGNPCADQT